jgi:hypothetical protein
MYLQILVTETTEITDKSAENQQSRRFLGGKLPQTRWENETSSNASYTLDGNRLLFLDY